MSTLLARHTLLRPRRSLLLEAAGRRPVSAVLSSSRPNAFVARRCKHAVTLSVARHVFQNSNGRKRRLLGGSAELEETAAQRQEHRPPFPVRVLLVGSTTSLLTPLFPVIGFNQLAFRFADPGTRLAITGGTSMAYFSAMWLFPNAFYYAPVLLPFAIGNGIVAGSLYGMLETAVGGPSAVARLGAGILAPGAAERFPVAGMFLGCVTAMAAPFAYPVCWELVFPSVEGLLSMLRPELYCDIGEVMFGKMTGWIVWPCLATTGMVAGALIHVFLKPAILGIPGVPWQKFSLAVLLGCLASTGILYSTSARTHVHHILDAMERPEGWSLFGWSLYQPTVPCYVNGEDEMKWVPGLDHHTGNAGSVLIRKDGAEMFEKDDLEKAARAQAIEEVLKRHDEWLRCYDNRRSCFFDGLDFASSMHELTSTRVNEIMGETSGGAGVLITDIVVLLVLGGVGTEKLTESVRSIVCGGGDGCYDLKKTALLRRLTSTMSRFRSFGWGGTSWAQESHDPAEMVRSLRLQAAQLREMLRLIRLDKRENGDHIKALRASLQESGIDVDRARKILARALNTNFRFEEQRGEDLALIHGEREKYKNSAIAVGGASLGLVLVACMFFLLPSGSTV